MEIVERVEIFLDDKEIQSAIFAYVKASYGEAEFCTMDYIQGDINDKNLMSATVHLCKHSR